MSQDSVAVTFQNRQDRGRHIAASSRVKQKAESLWVVPSQTHGGNYIVDLEEDSCSCPDHAERGATGVKCKHRWAVTFTRLETVKPDGTVVTQDTMKITYRQKWSDYNRSQCNQKADVQRALHALCSGIVQPPHSKGRPPLPWADVVIGNAMKVFTTFSSRLLPSRFSDGVSSRLLDGVVSARRSPSRCVHAHASAWASWAMAIAT